ncbi:MAG TPA: hypothetical protein VJM11_11835 [Nevskiaceae bacterium]|nr:hypothetical protein [Nevskiaceae bacterium]
MSSILGPTILAERVDAAHACFDLRIPDSGPGLDGHFPGVPILAGVVQVEWAQRLGRRCFAIASPVKVVTHLKFQRALRPGGQVTLELDYDMQRRELAFAYRVGVRACSSGRFQLDPP